MFTILLRIQASISQTLNLSPRRARVKKLSRVVVAEAAIVYWVFVVRTVTSILGMFVCLFVCVCVD